MGQDAIVNLSLEVGTFFEELVVEADASLVNTTAGGVSGLVGEREIRDRLIERLGVTGGSPRR